MAQVLTDDLEQIDGGEAAAISSAQSLRRRYQLPEIVDSGETGTQIADLTLLIFTNSGAGECELFSFETARVFARLAPYSKSIMRAVMNAGTGVVGWQMLTNRETIIATAESSHVADLTSGAVTTVDSAVAVSSADSYTEADVESDVDTGFDTVIGAASSLEVDFDAAVAAIETKIAAIIDVLEARNISAAA